MNFCRLYEHIQSLSTAVAGFKSTMYGYIFMAYTRARLWRVFPLPIKSYCTEFWLQFHQSSTGGDRHECKMNGSLWG